MLVITRKSDEKITMTIPEGITGTIEVMIVSIDRGQVKLGIKAPRAIKIYRNELEHLEPPALWLNKTISSGRYYDDIQAPPAPRLTEDEFSSKLRKLSVDDILNDPDLPSDGFSDGIYQAGDTTPDPKDTL